MIVQSPCKVNLGLKIINQRKDGYHNILSNFIELNLCDSIEFIDSNYSYVEFIGANIPKDNTVTNAIKLIENYCNININHKIYITKKIPLGSGLGGGSSNGAYTLKTLNYLYNLNMTDSELFSLSKEIGSDVPFFMQGGIKQISGTGDIIKSINYLKLKDKFFVLVIPDFSVSTSWAYKKIKKHLQPLNIKPKFPPLTNKVDWALFENDFEQVVCSAYPEILDIKTMFYDCGALYSSLSGSGSTMFGIYNDMKLAASAIECFKDYHTYLVTPNV
ncbi:MAG: 4-(cytidine 5'-diphospho)-2-C-methyl-D-erythritol kinase [Candidatus Marinimicrobia bacterium]|nr:4-(cytidine 5'-diphospho)-2-C-methyl-D-erythritol kinase [Candidatus Neomarinimicrobiota bacterium]|tara:strand:+ start:113464 stop:114285 length:822 start_codon:yes stop_codon:yes gene_type:complete